MHLCASVLQSTVAGGDLNTATVQAATVGGGAINVAGGIGATVAGGWGNTATQENDAVGGGEANSTFGYASTVPGGAQNQAGGNYSFAAGGNAHIRTAAEAGFPNDQNQEHADAGTFMWADSTGNTPPFIVPSQFTSSGPNQFLVRANGGFALNGTPVNSNVAMTLIAPLSNPGYASIFLRQSNGVNGVLISSGDASTGRSTANNAAFYIDQYNGSTQTRRMSLDQSGNLSVSAQAYKPGGGAWAASSDARLKTNVQPLDHALDRLLALRGVTFQYAHPDHGLRPEGTFTGFIAQEVEPKFPNWIGHDDKGYLTVGPQGFEALTVEALRSLKTDSDTRLAKLEKENSDLREQLAEQLKMEHAELTELRQQVAEQRTVLTAAPTRRSETSTTGQFTKVASEQN
jgi:trimeric autotransporter adhesin